jgi:hypothetical protein
MRGTIESIDGRIAVGVTTDDSVPTGPAPIARFAKLTRRVGSRVLFMGCHNDQPRNRGGR